MKQRAEISQVARKKSVAQKILRTIIHDAGAWILILPALLILYFFNLRTMLTGVWYSFHRLQGFNVQEFIGLENYIRMFQDTQFVRTLLNTLQYVFWSLIMGYLPPVIFAIMLNEMVHFRSIFKFSIYFPSIVPAMAIALLWYYMYLPDASGLINAIFARVGLPMSTWLQNEKLTIPLIIVTCTWGGFGSTVIMYLAALQGVNQELYEAAVVDGAGFFRRIISITVPQISGIMLLFVVKQMIGVFQIMTQPLVMTGGGPNGASTSLGLWSYQTAFLYFNTGCSLALGVITFLILMVMTLFYFFLKKKVDNSD